VTDRTVRLPAAVLYGILALVAAGAASAQGPAGHKTMKVQTRALGSSASVGGTVVPFEEITFTAQIPGRVERVAGGEGSFFRRGQVIAQIDDTEIKAQREAAIAEIRNAEAAVRNAGVQLQRERTNPTPTNQNMMDQMMPMNPMSMFGNRKDSYVDRRANLYSYGTQVEQARGHLTQARSRLSEIEAKMNDTKSVAPFDGYITQKFVNQGDTVQPGQPLVKFANMAYLQVQADLPSRLAAQLQPGAFLEVRLDDAHKTRVKARVAQVFPMADPTRHTVRVKLDLPTTLKVKAGMYAEVYLQEPGQIGGALPVIPVSAVVSRGGLPMAYVMGPDGKPRLHLLRLGERRGDEVTVLTGLRGGETVVVDP
jgi:multidrug efflux pump subunit AcrA (membrane-fusion protein)